MRVRFETFELSCDTAELFKDGTRLKLQDQPTRLLILLASRAGQLVTREEIQNTLWEDGQFVEFEHAINVAVKKVREALGDDPAAPRLIETLPRKGYRFIARVEEVLEIPEPIQLVPVPEPGPESDSEFALPVGPARLMFLGVQLLYLTMYIFALRNMSEVAGVLGGANLGWLAIPLLIGAACAIPVRLYLMFTVGLGHPRAGIQYRRLLPYLMPWDWLWAAAPFLAVRTFGAEWALVFAAILVYPPMSQVILMRSIQARR